MMQKKLSIFICLVLSACLAACGAPASAQGSTSASISSSPPPSAVPSSSLAPSSSAPLSPYVAEPAEIPVAPQDAPYWKQLAYNTLVNNLSMGDFPIDSIEIYKPGNSDLVLVAYYGDGAGYDSERVWQLSPGGAILHYEGPTTEYLLASVSKTYIVQASGFPIIATREGGLDDELKFYLYQNGNPTYLFSHADSNFFNDDWEFSSDGIRFDEYIYTMGYLETHLNQGLNLGCEEHRLNNTMLCKKLYDYLFDAFEVTVDEDKPAWIYDYIRTLGSMSMLPYSSQPIPSSDIRLEIHEPFAPDGPPLLRISGPYHDGENGKLLCPTEEGTWHIFQYPGVGPIYYKDAAGTPIISLGNREYYSLDSQGMDFLFRSGRCCGFTRTHTPHYAYCDGVYREFDIVDDVHAWYETQLASAFARRGYVGDIQRIDRDFNEIVLPKKDTWPEIEAQLIDAMYTWYLENS